MVFTGCFCFDFQFPFGDFYVLNIWHYFSMYAYRYGLSSVLPTMRKMKEELFYSIHNISHKRELSDKMCKMQLNRYKVKAYDSIRLMTLFTSCCGMDQSKCTQKFWWRLHMVKTWVIALWWCFSCSLEVFFPCRRSGGGSLFIGTLNQLVPRVKDYIIFYSDCVCCLNFELPLEDRFYLPMYHCSHVSI